MNKVDQVNDCRWVVSSEPNAVNHLEDDVELCLPENARPLMPLLYAAFCESPFRPNKFNVMDSPQGFEELCTRLGDNAVHSSDAQTRLAGLWWHRQTQHAQEDAAFAALNALGCMYAWSLHRMRCERLTDSDAETQVLAQTVPRWPINHTNIEGRTVLVVAAMFARAKTIAHLIRHGADVHAHDYEHRTALHWVCVDPSSDAHLDCAEALLKASADPNARDVYHRTPLHAAVAAMSAPITRLLLAHGARMDACDKEGLRPIDLFVSFKPQAITDEMRQVLAEFDGQRLHKALSPVPAPAKRRL